MKQNISKTHFFGLKIKINKEKRKEIKRLINRHDVQQILTVKEKDNDEAKCKAREVN